MERLDLLEVNGRKFCYGYASDGKDEERRRRVQIPTRLGGSVKLTDVGRKERKSSQSTESIIESYSTVPGSARVL
jgi:hypothetical protein